MKRVGSQGGTALDREGSYRNFRVTKGNLVEEPWSGAMTQPSSIENMARNKAGFCKLSKALQVQFHHVDLKAAALPTCLHRHIKPHQSLFLLGEKSFSTFYGTQDKWQAKFTARGSTVLIRASAFQSGADLCPDNPGCGKSSSACLCDVPRMSVIQGSVRASGRGNMQLVKVETRRECDMAAPLLILDIAHCKVFINF